MTTTLTNSDNGNPVVNRGDGPQMILIPAGEFLFGVEKIAMNMRDQIPPETLTLPAFHIDAHEVTNGQYAQFVEATGHTVPDHWADGKPPEGKEDHPVVMVTYPDASAYCEWSGKRLPTEMEWEKAARCTDGREFPWGSLIGSARCNCHELKVNGTTPVHRFPKGQSPYGVWDMVGNVWEWTSDWYDNGKSLRVVRGGSFNLSSNNIRCTVRYGIASERKRPYCGFRCVRDAVNS